MELIAKRYKLTPAQVTVLADHVGGGFGSKGGLGIETIAAIELARRQRRRSGWLLIVAKNTSVTGYRPAAEMNVALLPSRDGQLKALSFKAYADTGAAVNSTIAGLARLIYPAEAKELADFDVVSNLPPGAPFRGPGGPPMAFALEQAVDEAALRLNVDPIALRKRWDPNPSRQRLYDWASSLDVWRKLVGPATQAGRLSSRYWYRNRVLALSLAARVQGGTVSEERTDCCQYSGPGYRHGQPNRSCKYRRRRIRP